MESHILAGRSRPHVYREARILDGRVMADDLLEKPKFRVGEFRRRRWRPPGLAVVLVGEDPASGVLETVL